MTTKLLAVDDSKTMRRVLEITFSGEEFETTISANADQALSVVRSGAPEVAVVDGHLGDTSGYDLCRAIKELSPGTRVLILSSKQRPYDEAKGASVGADGSFDKPFDSTKFLARVQEEAKNAAPTAGIAAPAPRAAAPAQATASPAFERPVAQPPLTTPSASVAARRPQAPPARTSAAPPQTALVAKAAPPAVAAKPGATADFQGKLEGLGLSAEQVASVLALSREVVEQVVWEVVPVLAETLIKEEIARLTAE